MLYNAICENFVPEAAEHSSLALNRSLLFSLCCETANCPAMTMNASSHDLKRALVLQVSPQIASKECVKWLKEHGAVLSNESSLAEGAVDCKASANTLVMPAAVAVAHGDANLAIDDFLKSMS